MRLCEGSWNSPREPRRTIGDLRWYIFHPSPCSMPLLMQSIGHGCYTDQSGKPMRNSKWIRWEIKAKSFSYRHPHLLLFSDGFVDIRHAPTGQFKQMVEAKYIRLLDSVGIGGWKGSLFLGWRGSHHDKHGRSWALVEGLETAPLEPPKTPLRIVRLPHPTPIPDLSVSTRPPPNAELWDL